MSGEITAFLRSRPRSYNTYISLESAIKLYAYGQPFRENIIYYSFWCGRADILDEIMKTGRIPSKADMAKFNLYLHNHRDWHPRLYTENIKVVNFLMRAHGY